MGVAEHRGTRRLLGRSDRHDRARPAVEADSVATIRRSVRPVTHPGLGRQIEESKAVAIDGEIFQDAYLVPLKPESEIYLIPKIGGG
jgi:hypothetical protein